MSHGGILGWGPAVEGDFIHPSTGRSVLRPGEGEAGFLNVLSCKPPCELRVPSAPSDPPGLVPGSPSDLIAKGVAQWGREGVTGNTVPVANPLQQTTGSPEQGQGDQGCGLPLGLQESRT